MRIYLDNAATTALSPTVLNALLPYLTQHYGNPSSIHADGRAARAAIEQARKTVARHLNASVSEIFFTSCGSESNNMAIKCAVRDLAVQRIITTRAEHHCVLHSVEAVQRTGIEVLFLDLDTQGHFDINDLEIALQSTDKQTLVSLMYGNNEIGTRHPIAQIGALCAKYKAYFHTDTVQAVGHEPLDVQALGVDFLSGSAHKFHGPKGVGFLYINSNTSIAPFIDGGAQERNMRGGTENVAGIIGLAVALDEAYNDMEINQLYIKNIKNHTIKALQSAFDDIEFNGDLHDSLNHILSVSFAPSMRADMLVFNLDVAGISASGGSACSSGVENASHVMAATRPDSERRTLRLSFSQHTTTQEIDTVIAALQRILK